ncbi:MAG: nitrile hydratase accessory protein [Hyphomonadaceae bacterium]|nr:nitrile hydratase accessory protein [Hyphomonadaceae bacterium]
MSPPDANERVFDEPWQATAFAMTVALHERGLFTWTEWAEALGQEVKRGDAYYNAWLRALEKILAAKSAAAPQEVDRFAAAWERAAHATPHGQPIVLENDPKADARSP